MTLKNKISFAVLFLVTTVSTVTAASSFYDQTLHRGDIVAGLPLEEYSNIWWQWTQTVPPELSPINDLSGSHCHQGQSGDVWFLAGGYGSSRINRACTIPEGKHVFFPVINMLYYPREDRTVSCESVKNHASLYNDELLTISVELDQVPAINPAHYRMSSPDCFDLFGLLPEDPDTPKIYPSASDGYWVMLKPLSKGKHVLKFSAQYGSEKGSYSKMAQDIYYELTVE